MLWQPVLQCEQMIEIEAISLKGLIYYKNIVFETFEILFIMMNVSPKWTL